MHRHPAELAAPPSLGASTTELGGALCLRLEADPRSAMFNRVLGLGLERPATEGALEQIVSFFGEAIGWAVALAPRAQPAELPAWLDAAAAAGCEVVATETGEPRGGEPGGSWRNIARAGFEPQYVRPNYVSGPDDA